MDHVMLDLETLSSTSRAAIVSVGAVSFDLKEGVLGDTFHRTVDLHSYEEFSRDRFEISFATVEWWMSQSDEAIKSTFKRGDHVRTVLADFSAFVSINTASPQVWGNGADFDNVVLKSAYDACGLAAPWSFRGNRCYRTLRAMLPPVDVPFEGARHNALADAVYQAKYLIEAWKRR